MSKGIDYEAEVKKVFPEMTAFYDKDIFIGYFDWYIGDGNGGHITNPFTLHDSEKDAWAAAYTELNKKNKS